MVVGILSDTHLERPWGRLEELLTGPLGVAGAIIHAGDHVAQSVADHLEFVDPRPYFGVAGNCDPPALLRRFGSRRVFELEAVSIGLVHGWGPGEGLTRRVGSIFEVMPRVVVFGHSHRPEIVTIGETLFVNPGSATQPRGGGRPTAALLTITGGAVEARIVEV